MDVKRVILPHGQESGIANPSSDGESAQTRGVGSSSPPPSTPTVVGDDSDERGDLPRRRDPSLPSQLMDSVRPAHVFSDRPFGHIRFACTDSTQELLTVQDLLNCGIYLSKPEEFPTADSLALGRKMSSGLSSESEHPRFDKACEDIRQTLRSRDKATLLAYITEHVVYRAEVATQSLPGLCLQEDYGRYWDSCTPLISGHLPQPDYCVGFATEAFDKEEMRVMMPWLAVSDRILYSATESMHFPFLTCMVVGCDDDFEEIDRQNTYCASVAVNSLVRMSMVCELQNQLHGQVLAYSITHSSEWSKVYGHYPLIHVDENGGTRVTFCRYRLLCLPLAGDGGATKSQIWRFTRNVYFDYAKVHFGWIHLMIQEINAKLRHDFDGFIT
ncbi:MAG: hypothetical protein Q9174_004632 [Haloplaca sp. 1 TL-2023]